MRLGILVLSTAQGYWVAKSNSCDEFLKHFKFQEAIMYIVKFLVSIIFHFFPKNIL